MEYFFLTFASILPVILFADPYLRIIGETPFSIYSVTKTTAGVIEIVASLNERSTANASIGFFDVAAWDRFKARHPTITSPDLIEFQTGSSPPFLRINSCARNGSQGKEIRLRPSIRILSVSRNSKRRSSLNRGSFSFLLLFSKKVCTSLYLMESYPSN